MAAFYAVERQHQKTGRSVHWLFRLALIVLVAWLVLFHISEYYFFQATGTPLNLNIIVDNIRFVHEDAGYVSHVPLMPILLVACFVYEILFLRRFRAWLLRHGGEPQLRRVMRVLAVVICLLLTSLIVFLARDFADDSRRASVEYFRPLFVARDAVKILVAQPYQGPKPDRSALLSQFSAAVEISPSLMPNRYNVVAVTIESFNQIYLHPEKIHSALIEPIMPNFPRR